jgi:hypothetical protein
MSEPESAWSRRYREAVARYEGMDLCSQEAVAAVIEGLQEWLRLVPQRSVDCRGVPEPANKWGLGAERCVLRALHSHLVATGKPLIAARIRSEMADLLQTAESLDECQLEGEPDQHAVRRLVASARIQTKALIKLLSAIRIASGHVTDGGIPRRRRGHPRRQDPAQDRRLMDEWHQVRGRAGMTRKEFCRLKGISFKDFIRAQDRFRKRAAQEPMSGAT